MGAQALLDPAVPGAEDLRDGEGDRTDEQAPDGRLDPAGQPDPVEQAGDPVEALGVEEADDAAQHADQGEPEEPRGITEVVAAVEAEQRREAGGGAEDDVADGRGDEAGQERLDVEVVAVEDLGGQHRAAERRPEDGPDARADPGRHRHPGIAGAEVELAGQEGSEAGTDLTGRSLPTTRSARADGERRGDDLDDDGAETDAPRVVVDGRDGRVGAVSLGVGGEAEDEDGAEQGPETDDQRQRPGTGERRRRRLAAFADRRRDVIAGQDAQEEVRGSQEGFVEDDGADAGHGADQPAEDQPLLQVGGPTEPA